MIYLKNNEDIPNSIPNNIIISKNKFKNDNNEIVGLTSDVNIIDLNINQSLNSNDLHNKNIFRNIADNDIIVTLPDITKIGQVAQFITENNSIIITIHSSDSFKYGDNGPDKLIVIDKSYCKLIAIDINTWVVITYRNIFGSFAKDVNIFIGREHSAVIDNVGSVWMWGRGDYGQLSNNDILDKITPVKISTSLTFCNMVLGYYSTSALDNNGQAWSWGYGTTGVLGINTENSMSTPTKVCLNQTFCKISSGAYTINAIDYQGMLWSWGYNNYGQLGDGTTGNKSTPIRVCTAQTFCKISAGLYHAIALDKDGQAWAWGYNNYGQLGDNSITSRRTPVKVCLNITFSSISSGSYHTLGIDYQGRIWAWGHNTSGQLGDTSTTSKRTPIIIYTKLTFCQINAINATSAGIDIDNRLWIWGANNYGQLGINSNVASIKTLNKFFYVDKCFKKIGNGSLGQYVLISDYNDNLWSWGYNNYGQLGINKLDAFKNIPNRVVY